jgi:hypothetical protein
MGAGIVNGRWAAVLAVRVGGALGVAALTVAGMPRPAACASTYGFRARFDLQDIFSSGSLFGDQCSGTLSISATLLVAIAVLAALTSLASNALKRGKSAPAELAAGRTSSTDRAAIESALTETAAPEATASDSAAADQTYTAYVHALGLRPPEGQGQT